jgi:hypothetical protein
MEVFHITRTVDADGMLRIELPIGDANRRVEIGVTIQTIDGSGTDAADRTVSSQPSERKASGNPVVERVRKKHPRAYEPWTKDEEAQLLKLHNAGESINIISNVLQRQPGAIESRLRKLSDEGGRDSDA